MLTRMGYCIKINKLIETICTYTKIIYNDLCNNSRPCAVLFWMIFLLSFLYVACIDNIRPFT